MAGPRSAARIVHDTPELLRMILNISTPVSWLGGDNISRASLACLEFMAQQYHSSVTWEDYLTLRSFKDSKIKSAYLCAIRRIKVTEADRAGRSSNSVRPVIYTPKVLLAAREACPNLCTIVAEVTPWSRLNEFVVTFPPLSTSAVYPPPQLMVHRTLDISSVIQVEGCEDNWQPQQWKGWDVEGWLCVTIKPLALQEEQQDVKRQIISRLNSPQTRRDAISRLRLQDIPWSLEELCKLLECDLPDGTTTVRSIHHLECHSIKPFSIKDLPDFGQRAGTYITFLQLGSVKSRNGPQAPAESLPIILDEILSNFPRLSNLTLSIDWRRSTELNEVSAEVTPPRHDRPFRLDVELYRIEDIGTLRSLKLAQAILKRFSPQIETEFRGYDSGGLIRGRYEEWSELGDLLSALSRPLYALRRKALLAADLTQVQASSISEVFSYELLTDGTFPSHDIRCKKVEIDSARTSMHAFRRRTAEADDSVQRIVDSIHSAWSRLESTREATESTAAQLRQQGVIVPPLEWPREDLIPEYHRCGVSEDKLFDLRKEFSEKMAELAEKDRLLAEKDAELARNKVEMEKLREALEKQVEGMPA